jgi:hypothetical protein
VEGNGDSQISQSLTEPLTVGVKSRAAGHFFSDRNHFSDQLAVRVVIGHECDDLM